MYPSVTHHSIGQTAHTVRISAAPDQSGLFPSNPMYNTTSQYPPSTFSPQSAQPTPMNQTPMGYPGDYNSMGVTSPSTSAFIEC
jgi:hypothetical protein